MKLPTYRVVVCSAQFFLLLPEQQQRDYLFHTLLLLNPYTQALLIHMLQRAFVVLPALFLLRMFPRILTPVGVLLPECTIHPFWEYGMLLFPLVPLLISFQLLQ